MNSLDIVESGSRLIGSSRSSPVLDPHSQPDTIMTCFSSHFGTRLIFLMKQRTSSIEFSFSCSDYDSDIVIVLSPLKTS